MKTFSGIQPPPARIPLGYLAGIPPNPTVLSGWGNRGEFGWPLQRNIQTNNASVFDTDFLTSEAIHTPKAYIENFCKYLKNWAVHYNKGSHPHPDFPQVHQISYSNNYKSRNFFEITNILYVSPAVLLAMYNNCPQWNQNYIEFQIWAAVKRIPKKTLLRYKQKKISMVIITMYDTVSICYIHIILPKHKHNILTFGRIILFHASSCEVHFSVMARVQSVLCRAPW